MTDELLPSDEDIRALMQKNGRKISSPHFENAVMNKIKNEEDFRTEVLKGLKISFYFFITALMIGIAYFLWTIFSQLSHDFLSPVFLIIGLFIFLVVGMVNTDNYHRVISTFSSTKSFVR